MERLTPPAFLTSADLESFWLIGVYALVGLALAALALILYRRRRSETAGDVVAVGWLRPVFRYGVAGALCPAGRPVPLLPVLVWLPAGEYYDTLPMVVCLLAAGAIGYYGASMLLAKAFKVFRGSWKGPGHCAGGLCPGLLCAAFRPAGCGGPGAGGLPDPDPGDPDCRQHLHAHAGEGRGPAGAGQGPPSNGGCRRILCSGDGGPQIFHLV